MISRQHFINKLRELGYTFSKRTKRRELWRKRGGTHRVFLPSNKQLSTTYAAATLRQCGCDEDEILEFIRASTA